MKRAYWAALLCAGLSSYAGAGVRADCSAKELAAGSILDDGSIAGEAGALRYLKATAPELYARLVAMPKIRMRAVYGRYFVWFQRGHGCRERQKQEMRLEIGDQLRAEDAAKAMLSASDPGQKRKLGARIDEALADLFDSDIRLSERDVINMKEQARQLEKDIERYERELAERRASKSRIVALQREEIEARAPLRDGGPSDCRDYGTCYNVADLHVTVGDCAGAARFFGKALDYRRDPWAYFHRSIIRRELGDVKGADADLARALSLGKPGDSAQMHLDFKGEYGPHLRCLR